MACQDLRHLLAHPRNAQGVNEPVQLRVLGLLDAREEVRSRLFRHALEPGEGRLIELVEIRRAFRQIALDQLVDDLLAQAFDVHRAAAREMEERLLPLRLAVETPGAACRRLAFDPHHR